MKTADPWTRPQAILAVLGMPIATSATLYFFYDGAFPWVRPSLLLTLVTGLAAVARPSPLETITGTAITFAFVLVPVVFMFAYPGTEALGLRSDGHIFVVLAFLIPIHGVGFALCRNAHQEAPEDRQQE